MTHITPHVTYHRDAGFTLMLEERSVFRDAVLNAAGTLCAATGHRFCNSGYSRVSEWADSFVNKSMGIPTNRFVADQLARIQGNPGSWDFLDD